MDLSFVTRKFQRSIAGLSLLAILASFAGFTGTAFAKTFSDVSSSSFAYDQIDALSEAGIMTGEGDGSMFNPSGYITREEAAKVLVEAFVGSVDTSYDADFSDVMDGQWYTDYVNTAALYGIFSGNPDGTFGVGDYINRADFAKTAVAAAGLESSIWGSDQFSDVPSGSYYDSAVGTAWAYSIVDGVSATMYNPGGNMTREQAAKVVYNAMNPVYRGDEGTDNGNTGSSDATVMVEVSGDTPEADTIPSKATSVELASFDFTAEGDDSELDGLTVHQYGISSVPSAATVYLYNGAERLTSGTTVNSTTHESDFRNLNVELPEGETVTLTVRMDMGTWSTTGEVGFEIASADKVDAGESAVEGDFPAMADKFSVSNTSVGSVTIEKNGTIDNAEVGSDDVYVAKFKLTAGSTEGGYVKELGLYISGSVSTTDVENLRLYVSGSDAEPIAQVDNVDDLDVARFVVGEGEGVMEDMEDGYLLEKGDSNSFYVLADLNTGRTDDTIKAYLDQNTDLMVVGDLYGYGMAVSRTASDSPAGSYDGTTCTSSSGNCTFQTLKGGDITVSSNGPAATDVAINGKDVTLLNFVVNSITDVTFDNFPLLLTASESADLNEGLLNNATSAANFTDIKIVDTDTGSQLYSSVDSTSLTQTLGGSTIVEGGDTTGYYLWTDDWYVDAGSEYNLSVKADVANTSGLDTMTIIASLPFDSTYPVMKDANNKVITNSSSFVPTSTITGKTMTVRAPSLALSLGSSPASGSNVYVKGTQDVQFTGIVFSCGKSTSCKVTNLTLQGYLDDNGNASAFSTTTGADHTTTLSSYVGSVWLEDSDGNTVAGSKNVSNTDSTVQFTNLNWSIDAGDTEILYVVGNIATDAYKNSDAENIAFGISSAANVTVENADGNSFSATGTVNTTPTTYVTTAQGGTLAFSVSGSTPRENIQVAGSSEVEVSNFTLTSTREAFMVDTISVNNRQGAVDGTNAACVTVACLGNYDHNVSRLKLTYTDADGASQSAYAYLTGGTANFTGLELYVPKDSSTTVKVYADLQPIASSGSSATAGQWVDLALAFDTFNATSEGSGSTFTVAQFDASNLSLTLDNGTGAGTSLFNTLSFSNTGAFLLDGAQDKSASHTVGTTMTLVIDNNGAVTAAMPVGTFICADANNGGTCATEDIYVVTGRTAGATEDTYTVRLADDAGNGNYSDNIQIIYALPGTGYFTATNRQQVYKTKPTLTLNASSPASSRSVSTSDDAFIFDIYAASNEKVSIRTAQINDATTNTTGFGTASALAGAWTATDARSTVANGGIGNSAFQRETSGGTDAASLIFTFTANADLSGYKGLSFWTRASEAANTIQLTINDSTGTDPQISSGAMTASTWQFVDMPFDGTNNTTSANLDVISTLTFAVQDGSAVNAATYDVDRVALYYEKITVNVAADANIDTFTGSGADNLAATLKQGGSTVATGYFYSSTQGANASTGTITFYPQAGVDAQIDVDKGTTKSFTLNTSTSALLNEQSGVDDHLTFSINLGSSTDGSVSAGDFWWFDNSTTTTATVKWVGKTDNAYLTSNTVSY